MGLQPCYECNKEISTKAIVCPKCGDPLWKWKLQGLIDIFKRPTHIARGFWRVFVLDPFKNFKKNREEEKKSWEEFESTLSKSYQYSVRDRAKYEEDKKKEEEDKKKRNLFGGPYW